jgi:hypothetical protein
MVEYHVDTCDLFQQQMNEETKYGGRRSVKYKEGKMLIIWGHNEAIVKQFALTKKMEGPNRETAIVPKDEGAGIRISAFQSRESGFGQQMSKQELTLVKAYCRDKTYQVEEAVKEKGEMQRKIHLPEAPSY